MSTTLEVKQLGLAAFIRMNGAPLMEVKDRLFIFHTDVPLEEWSIRYNNSCCMRHDSLVCELRHHLQNSK